MKNMKKMRKLMMSIILLLFINSVSFGIVNGQLYEKIPMVYQPSFANKNMLSLSLADPPIIWEHCYGGAQDDELKSIFNTADGGYMLCGYTKSFGDYFGDAWLVKTDSNGEEEWNCTYGGEDYDSFYDVVQTTDGGFIAVGETSSLSYRPDGWVIKVDSQGNEEWNCTYGGDETEINLFSLEQTPDNGFILVGYKINNNFDDMWIIKIDKNGAAQWDKTFFEDKYHDWVEEIIMTPDEGYVLVGTTAHDKDTRNTDMLIIKVDNNGNELWRSLIDNGDFEYAAGVELAENGDLLIIGVSQEIAHNVGLPTQIELVRIDQHGQKIWSTEKGDKNKNEFCSTIRRTMDNGYLIFGAEQWGYSGPFDCLITKIDSDGHTEWVTTHGGHKNDFGTAGFQTIQNHIVIGGSTESSGSGKSDFWLFTMEGIENQRPERPSQPVGPTTGKFGEEMSYRCSGIEPDNEELYFLFDWGDDTDSGWRGPYESGQLCEASHFWEKEQPWNMKGSYDIKVKTRDSHGGESSWSDPLVVSMPKNKVKYLLLYKFHDNNQQLYLLLHLILKISTSNLKVEL